jgi:hypothetical protein
VRVLAALAALAAVGTLAACSGSIDSAESVATASEAFETERADEADPSSSAPPVTQLSPEAREELGSLRPPATGGESVGPLGQTVLDVDTGEGSVQIGEGEVPSMMAGLPAPDGLQVQLASSTEEAAGYSGVSTSSIRSIEDFFRSELVARGFSVEDESPSPTIVVLRFASPEGDGDVALSEAPGGGGTSVIVTFSRSP